jgi:serine/threonine protein kinase
VHKSAVSYHGLLSCQNCLIDANWVLKLTNFGVVNLLNTAIEREQLKLMEIIPFNAYFTSSPENLQDIAYGRMFPKGSRQGDIYSFGKSLIYT